MIPDKEAAEYEVRASWPDGLPESATKGRFDIVDMDGNVNWSAALAFTNEIKRQNSGEAHVDTDQD